MAKVFYWLFLWNFKKKARFCHSIWLFLIINILKIYTFLNFSADKLHGWGILLLISLGRVVNHI